MAPSGNNSGPNDPKKELGIPTANPVAAGGVGETGLNDQATEPQQRGAPVVGPQGGDEQGAEGLLGVALPGS